MIILSILSIGTVVNIEMHTYEINAKFLTINVQLGIKCSVYY